jgi:hypothetical protein
MTIPAFSTSTGFAAPTFDELLAFLAAAYQGATGIVVDLNPGPGVVDPTLAWLRTTARLAKALYDDLAGTYASGFVGSADGAALANLLSPFIGAPLAAVESTQLLPVTGDALSVIPAGSQVTLDTDGTGALPWTLEANINLDGGGNGSGTFRYAEVGPKTATAPQAWTIATPLANWASVGPSAVDAAEGRLAETTIQYRQRFTRSAEGTAVLAAVLAVDGVTSASLFENPTDIPDDFWGLTHWIEVLVTGGVDAEVGQAIFDTRCLTAQTVGTTTQAVTAPAYPGGVSSVKFSRPNPIDVWAQLTITKGEGYPTDNSAQAIAAREDAIRNAILAWASTRPAGLDVTAFQVAAEGNVIQGIANIAALVDTVNPPAANEVAAGPRDILVFDAARILLVGV